MTKMNDQTSNLKLEILRCLSLNIWRLIILRLHNLFILAGLPACFPRTSFPLRVSNEPKVLPESEDWPLFLQTRPRRRNNEDRTFRRRPVANPERPRGPAPPQPRRQAAAKPKRNQHRTLRIEGSGKEKAAQLVKQKVLKYSDVRLKVRNLDEKQVTNDDLKKLFQKIGDLRVCRFDRNEFGQFLGSATVTFERPEDAKRAVNEYNGAYLDDRVLTVEFDFIQ